jgi:hypothetical protein
MHHKTHNAVCTQIWLCLSCCLPIAPAFAGGPQAAVPTATVNGMARLLAGIYGSAAERAISRGDSRIKPIRGPAAALARARLVSLGFPGRSDRLDFVVGCTSVVPAKSVVPGIGSFSLVAWRCGDTFSALADLGGRAIAFSYTAPGRDASAVLLPAARAGSPKRPVLYWTNKGGIRTVLAPKVGPHSIGFDCAISFSMGGGSAAVHFSLQPGSARPPRSYIWSRGGYCVEVVPLAAHEGPGALWWTFGPLVRRPAGSHSFLITGGFCPGTRRLASRSGAIAISVGRLRSLGIQWAPPPRCPVRSAFRGANIRRLAPARFGNLFAGILKGSNSVRTKGRNGVQIALGHGRLGNCPRAVVAFLKWVGGGALGWYRHHRARELHDVLRGGEKLYRHGAHRPPAPLRPTP